MSFDDFEKQLEKADAMMESGPIEDAATIGFEIASTVSDAYQAGLLDAQGAFQEYERLCDVFDLQNISYAPFELGLLYWYLSVLLKQLEVIGDYLSSMLSNDAREIGWSPERIQTYCIFHGTDSIKEKNENLIKQTEKDPGAWFYIGLAQTLEGNFDEAEDAFNQVPVDDPNYAKGMCYLAENFEQGGHFALSLDYYERALDAEPTANHIRRACELNKIKMNLQFAAEEFMFDKVLADIAYRSIDDVFEASTGYRRVRRDDAKPKEDTGEELERYIARYFQLNAEGNQANFNQVFSMLQGVASEVADLKRFQERTEEEVLEECEKTFSEQLSFWDDLAVESREKIKSAEYFLGKSLTIEKLDLSSIAIHYTGALEIELRKIIFEPLKASQERAGKWEDFRAQFKIQTPEEFISLGSYAIIFENKSGRKAMAQMQRETYSRKQLNFDDIRNKLAKINRTRRGGAHTEMTSRDQVMELRESVFQLFSELHLLKKIERF